MEEMKIIDCHSVSDWIENVAGQISKCANIYDVVVYDNPAEHQIGFICHQSDGKTWVRIHAQKFYTDMTDMAELVRNALRSIEGQQALIQAAFNRNRKEEATQPNSV